MKRFGLGFWFSMLVLGCRHEGPGTGQTPHEDSAQTPQPSSSAPAALATSGQVAPLPPDSKGAGDLYLSVDGAGVVRLDGDRFVPVYPTTQGVLEIARGAGRDLWVSSYHRAVRRGDMGHRREFRVDGRAA
jgi:hypothetical protein